MKADEIFQAASEKATAAERAAYLDGACARDPALRAKVEGLLQSHDEAGSFLQQPLFDNGATVDQPLSEAPGTVIGPYKLLQQIGEGGMGVVYMAEQSEPVERRVALKIIKPGMDTRQIIARFEAERQALAMMDHPNIARVLDAGTTDSGRPYFVMELVRGVPITSYCDEHHLTPQERLRLFLAVCHAVQHAHLKGIIHRDLKPTNVLVAEYDDHPVPKVIDFGVAKATSKLTDKTMFTQFGQIVGTLEYMSPEQSRFNELDVDTRSDVYSLGVLLYELLTGSTPFDKDRLRLAAFDEVIRILREEEPPRPSTRLSTADARASVAALRKMEPRKLSTLVRGELDWIVMKALEKDRGRRYETANAFAADIHNYLTDAAVLACPPSRGYRFQKFARRNKAALATAAMVAAALVAGIIGTTWQAIRATQQADRASIAEALADRRYADEKAAREQADAARAEKEVQRQAAEEAGRVALQREAEAVAARNDTELQRQRAEANFDKARRAVDEYLTQVTDSELLTVPGLQPLREDLLKAALTFYAEFTRERADDPTLQRELASAHYRLGQIYSELGDVDAAATANAETIRRYEQLRDAGHFDSDMQVALAWAYYYVPRYDDTVQLCQDVLVVEPGHAEARSLLADTWNALGNAESERNEIEAALGHHRQAFELRETLVRDAPENSRYLAQLGGSVNNLGVLLARQGEFDEALPMYERAVEYTEQAYERAPHSILFGRWLCACLGNVAGVQAKLGLEQDALATYQRLVAISRKRAFENPAVTSLQGDRCAAHLSLARYQQQLGNTAAAARSFRQAREVLENIPRETPDQLYELATVYAALAQPSAGAIEPNEEEAAERQRNIELTLQTLRQAVDAGFSGAQKLRSERQFDVIRERDDFQQLITLIESAVEADQLAGRDSESVNQTLADRLRAAELLSGIVSDQPGALRHRATLAATLHSIGVIQTGLQQFDEAEQSLREALRFREDLVKEQPGNAQAQLDALATRSAIGQLLWNSGRPQEAHRYWQDILAECRQAAAEHPEDTTLQSGIRRIEWTMAQTYGEVGLWELAVDPVDQSLKSGQLDSSLWDCRGAHLLAAQGRLEEHREFCRLIAEKWGVINPENVVWAATMSPEAALDTETLLELAGRVVESSSDPMARFQAATAWYRSGEYERALELMLPFREVSSAGGSADLHWYAMVYHKLGQPDEAAQYFEQAEAKYLRFANQCLQAPEASAVTEGHGGYWWAWAEDQAVRQTAWDEIKGPGSLQDPWQHLIQARAYRLIGEPEKCDAELAAAISSADDFQVWMARARLLSEWDDPERSAEADWQKAVDLAGGDPLPWIHRGRWYAGRGEQEKADADFANAASLTPNELNRFLEAGWWVVGPYPENLAEFCPPEIDSDPSRPVFVIEASSGLSDDPAAWINVPTGAYGTVDLSTVRGVRAGSSVYAMAQVYSPVERSVLLMIGKTEPLRVWVNGVLVEDYVAGEYPVFPYYEAYHRFPIVLRTGNNTLLIKCAKPRFTLRIGDSPRDRAVLLAEQERFSASVIALNELQLPASEIWKGVPWKLAPILGMPHGPHRLYQSYCEAARTRIAEADGQRWLNLAIPWICSQQPNRIFDEHAEQLVSFAERYAEESPGMQERLDAALANYRAGRYERAQSLLTQFDLGPYGLPLQSLVFHQTGNAASAAESLEAALSAGVEHVERMRTANRSDFHAAGWAAWWYWAPFLNLLTEVEQAIRGETTATDDLRASAEATMARRWTESPEIAAFDHAVLFTARGPEAHLKYPQPLLARGRRMAELGRLDEAEADFNKAVQLAPNDADVLLARGLYFADLGQPERAAAELHAALNLFGDPDKPRWNLGSAIDLAAAQRDDVFEQLVSLRPPGDTYIWTARVCVLIRNGDLQAAQAAASHLHRNSPLHAALALLSGDRGEYERICASVPDAAHPLPLTGQLGLGPTDESLTAKLLSAAERLQQDSPESDYARLWISLAQLRAGNSQQVADELEDAYSGVSLWRRAISAPILAIAHRQLGDSEAARHWLTQSERLIHLYSAESQPDVTRVLGPRTLMPYDWLYALVLHNEAKQLIDGDLEIPADTSTADDGPQHAESEPRQNQPPEENE